MIQPYDKAALTAIERAIHTSDLGLNPQNDGKIIRVPVPPLTEERRKELVKHIKKVAEDYRVSVRNHRRDALEMLKELEKDKEITQDDHRHAHDKVEAMTKEYVERGRFEQPGRSAQPAWAHPVIANGRLYLRDQNVLFAYDIRKKEAAAR